MGRVKESRARWVIRNGRRVLVAGAHEERLLAEAKREWRRLGLLQEGWKGPRETLVSVDAEAEGEGAGHWVSLGGGRHVLIHDHANRDMVKRNPAIKNMLRVALDTQRMPSAMAGVMGGPTPEHAVRVLRRHGVVATRHPDDKQAESSWSLPTVENEVFTEMGAEAFRESVKPVYPTAKADRAKPLPDPFEALANDQLAVLQRAADKGDEDAQARLARLGAMRRRWQYSVNAAIGEADAGHIPTERPVQFKGAAGTYDDGTDYTPTGLSMADRQGGGRASGQYGAGDDNLSPEDEKQIQVDKLIDEDGETEVYMNERGERWEEGDGKKYQYEMGEDGELHLVEVDEEAAGGTGSDHGSHAMPTYAREPEEGGGGGASGGAAGVPGLPPGQRKTDATKRVGESLTEAIAEEMYLAERASHTKIK